MPPSLPWDPSPVLGAVLRWGSRLSIVLLAAGLAIALIAGQRGGSTLRADAIASALLHRPGVGVIGLGLVALICTPICREAVAAVLFARHGERTFTALNCVVLVLIVASLVVGAH